MSDHFYNNILYPAQDRILNTVAHTDTPFYLTGGTALGRFLLNHRFSDDLDFFVNAMPDFHDQVEHVLRAIQAAHPGLDISIRQDSFVRAFVKEAGVDVKIEFVNDVKYRVGFPVQTQSGIKVDHWQNILANKITALSRIAAKDFVDILFLATRNPFSWEEMIGHARAKDAWIDEINVSQSLFAFDIAALSSVAFPEHFDRSKISDGLFKALAKDALHGFDNSIVGTSLG
jgi:predicted nucleotidyltransferase component of viral defense system